MAGLKFPEGFLWGASTSSHQVEGGQNNDWSVWERLGKVADGSVSGVACDHWNRYEADFDIAKGLGHNAHRLSIEWSRIEPQEGEWNESAIKHYQQVIAALHERGLEPFVTLWHFTSPLWFMERGGWTSQDASRIFGRYVTKIAQALPDVRYWVPINEANVYAILSYLIGVWPPEKMNARLAYRVFSHLIDGHQQAYHAIKAIQAGAMIGSAHNMIAFEPKNRGSLFDRMATMLADRWYNRRWLRGVAATSDFIGVNHYTRQFVHWESLTRPVVPEFGGPNQTDFGWDMYPEGMYRVLRQAGRYGLPIFITENGLADSQDQWRATFITEYLEQVHRAIVDGVHVRGYFHWSLLDNFEWREGFAKRFGLVAVDYSSQQRTIRPSAEFFREICLHNQISLSDT